MVLDVGHQVLWQLLDQGAGKVPGAAKMPPLPQWRQEIERYCNSIPSYYGAPLRLALKRWGFPMYVVPEAMENSLIAGFVGNQLKRLRMQAKADLEEDLKRILVYVLSQILFAHGLLFVCFLTLLWVIEVLYLHNDGPLHKTWFSSLSLIRRFLMV